MSNANPESRTGYRQTISALKNINNTAQEKSKENSSITQGKKAYPIPWGST